MWIVIPIGIPTRMFDKVNVRKEKIVGHFFDNLMPSFFAFLRVGSASGANGKWLYSVSFELYTS